MKTLAQLAAGMGLAALAFYALLLAWLWYRQESLLFFPQPLPADFRLADEADVHELTIPVDGASISVLHLRLPNPRGVVFFLHGNAGNLAGWFSRTQWYRRANFDLVMLDYRGYGKSTGRIQSEQQLRSDVRAVWTAVEPRYRGKRVVLYGRSLGSGLAAGLASELKTAGRTPDLTLLVSPYLSIRELTREFYPWVPPFLLRYPLDTASLAGTIASSILLVHGARDEIIGVHHAQRLHAALPGSRLVVLPEAGHNDIQDHPGYQELLQRELARL